MNDTNHKTEQSVETPKPVKEKKFAESAGFCCYIGPTVMGYIQCGTLYPGAKSEVLKSPEVRLATDKYPAVADLIVDGHTLAECDKQIKIKGTALYEKAKLLTRKR